MNKNDFNSKWSKIFDSKKFGSKQIILSAEEQQELLDDAKSIEVHETIVRSSSPKFSDDNYGGMVGRNWKDEPPSDDDGHGGIIKHFQD